MTRTIQVLHSDWSQEFVESHSPVNLRQLGSKKRGRAVDGRRTSDAKNRPVWSAAGRLHMLVMGEKYEKQRPTDMESPRERGRTMAVQRPVCYLSEEGTRVQMDDNNRR